MTDEKMEEFKQLLEQLPAECLHEFAIYLRGLAARDKQGANEDCASEPPAVVSQ